MTFRAFLDWLTDGKKPEVLEAERDNLRVDRKQVDASLNRFMNSADEFRHAVDQLVRDLDTGRTSPRKRE